ncbi:MAG: M23 family metallopeptidase [Acidobacteria bacterium]|nr:M23 family metallopeptidase [Acidobacteriota bacterium]
MRWTPRLVCASLTAVVLIGTATTVFHWRQEHSFRSESKPATLHSVPAPAPAASTSETLPISPGDTLSDLLGRAGLTQGASADIVAAVDAAFDVRTFRAGSHLRLTRSESGGLERIEYQIDPDRKLVVRQNDGAFSSAVIDIPSTLRAVPVCGKLEGSLFESMEARGEPPELALQIAEIFAWDLDFYTDPQPGDEFCLLVEKKEYANDQPPGYGRILAAQYNNSGTLYEGYLFADEHGKDAWYSRDGHSLRSAFLRSPIKFEARVSSRFSRRRFHPVLKTYRPHLGTDYAVPAGTPVQAVAEGRVVFSGRSGGSGNLVRIKHAQGYETYYLHLSRRLVRRGQRVQQGQRIGLAGSTGLASGPHLDFRIRRNGLFQDFEKLRAPRALRISARRLATFRAVQQEYAALMAGASGSIMARGSGSGPEDLAR